MPQAGVCAFYVLVAGDDSVLGRFGLYDVEDGTARPGYRVAERVAGHGVATATVRELCRMATAMYGLRTLRAATFHDNAASRKVLAKAGFVSVGPATPADVGEDSMAPAGEMPTGMEAAINEYLNRARAAQASGNNAEAIAITSKVLEHMDKGEKRA